MSRSVANGTPSTALNSLVPRMAKASIAVNSAMADAIDGLAVSLAFDAMADAGLTLKEAAYEMAMDQAQLSRIKSGQGRLPFDALWRLPDRFWIAFLARITAAKQLTVENAAAIRRARLRELAGLLIEEAAS